MKAPSPQGERCAASAAGERAREGSARFELWRLDDNGNELLVDVLDSEQVAASLVARFEARGHKQTYFVRRRYGALRSGG